MKIEKIHHVAYRCHDAKQTVNWYVKNLKMDFVLAIAEDRVPSTGAKDPYMHVFLDAGNENVLAFFEQGDPIILGGNKLGGHGRGRERQVENHPGIRPIQSGDLNHDGRLVGFGGTPLGVGKSVGDPTEDQS